MSWEWDRGYNPAKGIPNLEMKSLTRLNKEGGAAQRLNYQ